MKCNSLIYDWIIGKSSSYVPYMYYTTCVKLFLLSISLLQSSGMYNAAE